MLQILSGAGRQGVLLPELARCASFLQSLSFLLRILSGAGRQGAKAPSPPQREFEAKKTDAHRMHAAPANSAMFISQVSLFCFELSLGRGAAPRCNAALDRCLSLFLNRARRGNTLNLRRVAMPCHAGARRVHCVAVRRADCSRLLSHRCSRALLGFCWCTAHEGGKNLSIKANVPR